MNNLFFFLLVFTCISCKRESINKVSIGNGSIITSIQDYLNKGNAESKATCKHSTIFAATPTEWKLYKTREISSFKLDTTELKKIENANADSISYYVQFAEKLDDNPVWQDFFITTCKAEGKTRKVIFSIYGGFFYDTQSRHYYVVKQEHRHSLIDYLERKLFPK